MLFPSAAHEDFVDGITFTLHSLYTALTSVYRSEVHARVWTVQHLLLGRFSRTPLSSHCVEVLQRLQSSSSPFFAARRNVMEAEEMVSFNSLLTRTATGPVANSSQYTRTHTHGENIANRYGQRDEKMALFWFRDSRITPRQKTPRRRRKAP